MPRPRREVNGRVHGRVLQLATGGLPLQCLLYSLAVLAMRRCQCGKRSHRLAPIAFKSDLPLWLVALSVDSQRQAGIVEQV